MSANSCRQAFENNNTEEGWLLLSHSLFRSFSISCGALAQGTRWDGIIPYSNRCFPFFFFSFFLSKKQSQVNLRITRFCTKSFFRIAYSGRPQNGRNKSKHIYRQKWAGVWLGRRFLLSLQFARGQNAENPCRAPGQLWVRSVQQQEAALRRLCDIVVENRPGSSDQANYRKAIDESLFYNICLIHSSHPVAVENANIKRTEIEGGKTKSYPVKIM